MLRISPRLITELNQLCPLRLRLHPELNLLRVSAERLPIKPLIISGWLSFIHPLPMPHLDTIDNKATARAVFLDNPLRISSDLRIKLVFLPEAFAEILVS